MTEEALVVLEDFPLQFERPGWLLLLVLLVPVVLLARRSWTAVSPGKAWGSLSMRTLVVLLLTGALSQPTLVKRGEGLTLMVIADRSQSIPLPLRQKSEEWLRSIVDVKKKEDRVGTIVVGREAQILSPADPSSIVPALDYEGDTNATNLAAGVRQALAIMPRDTAAKLLIVSDFNENVDSVMDEVEAARANDIPIDVLPLAYEHPNEVVVDSIRVQPRARVGQTGELRIFLRSQADAKGTLTLKMNDLPVDLDPSSPGDALPVELHKGPTVIPVPISFDEGGAQRFSATFTPASPSDDAVLENNVGSAVTFVAGGGRVLIAHSSAIESEALATALRSGGLTVDQRNAHELDAGGAAMLNGYDAIILANVERGDIDPETDRALHSYVHDLGGGLLMLGGDHSFGAGGWIDSAVSKALPVKMDPPATRQLVRGALALIIHACEMKQGNYWSQQVAIASIEALTRLDLIGIIVFGMGGSTWHHKLQPVGDKSAAIAAVRSMAVGDMQDFESSVGLAYEGLVATNAGQKHIIIVSDGDPQPPTPALLQKCKLAKITITTVMVSGHGTAQDNQNMKATAEFTGGRFHNVTNPKMLPKIFSKEATIVTRSLISEGEFQPQVVTGLPGPVRGFTSLPTLRGYVVTVPREGLAQIPIVVPSKEGSDPLYAWWNYGIGRSIAFTSDATTRWATAWVTWNDFRAFWEQSVRWLMRPASPSNISLKTRVEGETAIVELEAVGSDDSGFVNFLKSDAMVLAPDGGTTPLDLQQVGPGRYRGETKISQTGSYLVNVTVPTERDGQQVPASVQAAITVAYPKEFRTVRDNAPLGERIAERTGGRVLTMGDPKVVDPFDRTGLPVPRSAKRIWDLMAILAAALFIIDVAVRRLSIESGAARRLAERALGRTEDVGEATVAAWKKARDKAGSKTEPRAGGAASDAERQARSDAAKAAAGNKFEAGEGGPSFDVAAEAKGEPNAKPTRPGAATPDEPPKPEGDADAHTSRLLRAKRRAKSQEGGDDAGDGGGGDGGARRG
ncbi:MAG: glutamine amidotransferase [Phycisphaerales bacterium]